MPSAASSLAFLAIGLVDTAFVGRSGTVDLAALALGETAYWAFALFLFGVMQAQVPVLAAHRARGRPGSLASAHLHLRRLGRSLGLATLAAMFLGAGILGFLGQDPEVSGRAIRFLEIRCLALPLVGAWLADRGLLVATGRVRTLWVLVAVTNAVNLAGNLVLVAWAGTGIVGTAVATTVAEVGLWAMTARIAAAVDRGAKPRFRPRLLAMLLVRGAPLGLQLALEYLVYTILAIAAGWLGPIALAAHHMVQQTAWIALTVAEGLGISASVLVGEGGRGRDRPATLGIVRAGALACVVAMVAGASVVLGADLGGGIGSLLTSDPLASRAFVETLPQLVLFLVTAGLQVVLSGAMQGLGRGRQAAWIVVPGLWSVSLPLAIALAGPFGMGLPGIWLGMGLGGLPISLGLAVAIGRDRSGRRGQGSRGSG